MRDVGLIVVCRWCWNCRGYTHIFYKSLES
jgi:hypothetical protein